MKLTDLPPDARAQLEGVPPEFRDLLARCFPTKRTEQLAAAEAAKAERQRLADEQRALVELADALELGLYGQAGVELAQRVLANGGRTTFNLGTLRTLVTKFGLKRLDVGSGRGKR